MRKKLLLFTAVVMAALVMVLSGCGSSADKGTASGDKKVIKLGGSELTVPNAPNSYELPWKRWAIHWKSLPLKTVFY